MLAPVQVNPSGPVGRGLKSPHHHDVQHGAGSCAQKDELVRASGLVLRRSLKMRPDQREQGLIDRVDGVDRAGARRCPARCAVARAGVGSVVEEVLGTAENLEWAEVRKVPRTARLDLGRTGVARRAIRGRATASPGGHRSVDPRRGWRT